MDMNYLELDLLIDWNIQGKKGHFITSFWKCVFNFLFSKFLFSILSFACLCAFWFFLVFFTITVSENIGSMVLVQKIFNEHDISLSSVSQQMSA